MDLNITAFVNETNAYDFSGSMAERGKNAAKETWTNALEEAKERHLISTPDELRSFRAYVKGFGAWDDEEIQGWSVDECNALLIQMISGDLRELQNLCPGDGPGDIDWQEAEPLQEEGRCSSNLYCNGEDVFYYVGD